MSHSRKDGRRGGGHRNTQGREYWSPRAGYPMADPGRRAKTRTHRLERRAAKRLTREEAA
jgi:hypothetical protein